MVEDTQKNTNQDGSAQGASPSPAGSPKTKPGTYGDPFLDKAYAEAQATATQFELASENERGWFSLGFRYGARWDRRISVAKPAEPREAETIGPGIARSAAGKIVHYCICEEKDGDNTQCPIHYPREADQSPSSVGAIRAALGEAADNLRFAAEFINAMAGEEMTQDRMNAIMRVSVSEDAARAALADASREGV